MDWQPIETLPKALPVIGIKVHPGNDDTGVICGTKYDMRPNCVMDWQRGRWMECTHWAYPPLASGGDVG